MKHKQLIVILLITLCSKGFTQSIANSRIIPEQAGTITITSSKTRVDLSSSLKTALHNSKLITSYYVVFTATSDSELPFITDKNNNSFTVNYKDRTNKNLPASVDYVVFLKIEQKASDKTETFIQPDINRIP